MKFPLSLCLLPLILTGCATKNTTTEWSCVAAAGKCSTIAQTDAAKDEAPKRTADSVIFDARTARWWEPNPPGTKTREFDPRRDGDQVMRVVIAPFVDAQGDYHARSEIFAVVRRAQWWLTPPVMEASSPPVGTKLDAGDESAPAKGGGK